MPEFNVRSDSVNVEQIMEQIRSRIREKRGVDYTEQQIRDLAAVKLEKFLDPKAVRSDLLEQYRKLQPAYEPPELPNYEFEDSTLYETHRGPLRFIRKLLNPLLKLFFNPNKLIQALHIQARLNMMYAEREARREAARRATDQLTYELIHNLVVETTRLGIEVKNLKMRVESVGSRLEFNERRARALESVVVYKPGDSDVAAQAPPQAHQPSPAPIQPRHQPSQPSLQAVPVSQSGQPAASNAGAVGGQQSAEGPGQRSRRRRRRRGRRGGGSAAAVMGGQASPQPGASESPGDLAGESEAGVADEMEAAEDERETAGDARAGVDRGGTETHTAAAVVTNDLDQFSGSHAHPTEPFTRPADAARPAEPTHPVPAERSDATVHSPSQGPDKTDPDTQ
jgi:hypothetical protein